MQTYLRLEEIKLTLSDDEKIISDKIQKILGLKKEDIINYNIVKKIYRLTRQRKYIVHL